MADPFESFRPSAPETSGADPFEAYRPGAVSPQENVNPVDAILRDPKFQELLQVQELLQRAQVDPSVGDVGTLMDRLEVLTDQLLATSGMSRSDFGNLVRQEATQVDRPGYDRAERTGQNVIGAVSGVIEPVAVFGDANRTFIDNLTNVQEERDARTSGGRVAPGTSTGSPASNPIQAIIEMGTAAVRTAGDLGFDQLPFTREQVTTPEGETQWTVGLNEQSGWAVYAPSIVWDRYRFGVSPYEADLAVTGRDLNERFGVAERFGVETEEGKEWLGLATEVITDPLLFGDWAYLGARVFGTAGRVTGNAALRNAGTAFERAANDVYRAASPMAAVDVGRAVVKYEPFGIGQAIVNSVQNGMNRMLDLPMPRGFLRDEQRVAAGVLGYADNAVPQPRLRDLLFQGGVIEGMPGGAPRFLVGGEQQGLSAAERAIGYERVIQNMSIRAATEVSEALSDGLRTTRSFRLPWNRVAVQGAKVVAPEMQGYVRTLGTIVSDFADTTGMMNRAVPREFKERLIAASDLYNIPLSETMRRFHRANDATRRLVLQVGYETSGYRDYTTAMRRAANALGEDYNDMRRAFELEVSGTDLQRLETQDYFPTVIPGSTGAVAPDAAANARADSIRQGWAGAPDSLDLWRQAVADELEAMGRTDLSGIAPETYLRGIQDGYLRRMFAGVENPQATIRALNDRSVIVMRSVEASDAASELANSFGGAVTTSVRRFFEGNMPVTPRGSNASAARGMTPAQVAAGMSPDDFGVAMSFRTDDLAAIISREIGRPVTNDEVARVIYGSSPNFQYLDETLELVHRYAAAGGTGGSGSGGTPWGQTPLAFGRRDDLDFEALASRVMIRDPVTQVAETGMRGARQVRSQEFLKRAYDGLERDGLILPANQVPGFRANNPPGGTQLQPRKHIYSFMNDADGVKYVALPENPSVWGPLAGQAIPEEAARMMAYTLNFGRKDRGAYERVLSMWRRGLLSPLSTSLRNVVGNFLLIQQAGGNLTDMVQALPRATALRREFLETGRLPEQFRGYEYLFNFITDSTLSGRTLDSVEDTLGRVARGETKLTDFMDQAEAMVGWTTQQPALGGFLGFFKWGEEVSRTTAFLTKHDELVRAGVAAEDAIQRAAHFATNSAYNYGATPLFPDALRRTGLSAFPQFTWFTGGRTPRMLMQNPAAAARVEYGRQAANMAATGGDQTEEERITALLAGWEKYVNPVAIPLPGQDGQYYMLNLQYWLPQGANLSQIVTDPMTAGVYAPFIDTGMAWMSGEGTGPFGVRFGQRVFEPGDTTRDRIGQTAGFLGSQMLFTGAVRTADQLTQAVEYNDNKALMDMWSLEAGRFYNADWAQFAGRLLGLNTRRVSTTVDQPQSYQSALKALDRKYASRLDDLNRRADLAFTRGNNEEGQAIVRKIVEVEQQKAEEKARIANFMRFPTGNE